MSPVSRGRKRKYAKSGQSDLRIVRPAASVPETCDCPACSDPEFDPQAVIDDLVAGAAELLDIDDPMVAELFGATFVAAGEMADEAFIEALSEGIIPVLAQSSAPESLGALLAIGAVDGDTRASDAARRLLAAGVPAPLWMGELAEPVKSTTCRRYGDPNGEASMLLCSFERSGRSHGFIVHVDHLDCDAAADIILFAGDVLDEITGMIQADGRRAGVTLTAEELDPAELRWQVERALEARATHDRESGEPWDNLDDEDGPGYHPLAVLLRSRMGALPPPPRSAAVHGSRTLPPKRKKSDGPAPIYQIKVGLRGATPPIWRRLELPGDTSLPALHRIIQRAFGWSDSHLHVFRTPYGAFGVADEELGHRAEKPVTLEQVAPGAGDRMAYVYDFGDDWEHDIVVEKLFDRQAVTYPRCTGGRRAAPPDDCGGVWGYAALVEILSDPGHPEHEERLEWLGLRSADDFRPAFFDAAEVTRALTDRR